MLLPYLAADQRLAESFFGCMQMMFYAAASLPQAAWDELRRLAIQTTGERIFTTSTLGSTETAPLAITANWDADRPGIIGLPVPGVEVKLVPVGRRLEFKVRGPNVTPGYWKQPEKTRQAFDADGWYSLGDAVRFADPDDPSQGLMFDSRLAEDFKLSTGVWVHVGAVRAQAGNHLFPLVRDFVVCGHDRDEIGLLVFPDFEACRQFAGVPAGATAAEIANCDSVLREFRRRLDAAASGGASSSSRVVRALVLAEHPHPLEVTDKGSLAYNLVVERRAAEIAELYDAAGSPRVLVATDYPRR
jgi:feruloyl-CoA synthase